MDNRKKGVWSYWEVVETSTGEAYWDILDLGGHALEGDRRPLVSSSLGGNTL